MRISSRRHAVPFLLAALLLGAAVRPALAGIPDDYYPAAFSRSAERVAQDGYAGFMAGHRVVVPGKPNRFMTLLPRLVPHWLIVAGAEWWRNQARHHG